jgi:hypothetical protein
MLIVTFVALTLAVGMSVIAMRLFRSEKHRSAARVAALETAAYGGPDEFDDVDADDEGQFVDAFRETRAAVAPEPELKLRPSAPSSAPAPAHVAMQPRHFQAFADTDEDEVPESPMFGATDEPKAPPRRWAALAFVALVMAGLMGGAYALFKPATLGATSDTVAETAPASTSAHALAPAPAPVAPRNPGTQEPQRVPIELLSLKHSIDGSTFTLTGLAQNPIAGAPLPNIVAVVYLFDRDGAYFATGKAALEFRGLKPGEESPFTVKIPDVSRVGRYRVGFRSDDGTVIAHVDKRGQASAGLMTEGR